jgi:predicted metal-binding protein
MNRCIEGSYSSCTTAARPDLKKLRWDAVAIEMHETLAKRSLRLTFCFLLGKWI